MLQLQSVGQEVQWDVHAIAAVYALCWRVIACTCVVWLPHKLDRSLFAASGATQGCFVEFPQTLEILARTLTTTPVYHACPQNVRVDEGGGSQDEDIGSDLDAYMDDLDAGKGLGIS